MGNGLQIEYVEKPEEAAWGIIGRGVHEFNLQNAGDLGFERICYALRDGDGEIVGGALGEVYYGWLYVDLLWVKEDFRRRGYGSDLMGRLEEEARKRGAEHAFLDTFSFQAPSFYSRLGYEVYGELPDFPAGHQRVFMRKQL
jgi:GNAT superfamily N-acetyltransferase